jgi:hypothetical protein
VDSDGGNISYFTNAVHKDCGGLVRAMIEVTSEQKKIGFVCARCHAMWIAPDGMTFGVPPTWVEGKK